LSRRTTIDELTAWWLETVARHQVKVSTLDSYRTFVGYLSADIGAMPVVEVGAETLTVSQSNLLDRYAPFTVRNCRKVCRQAFTEAVKGRQAPVIRSCMVAIGNAANSNQLAQQLLIEDGDVDPARSVTRSDGRMLCVGPAPRRRPHHRRAQTDTTADRRRRPRRTHRAAKRGAVAASQPSSPPNVEVNPDSRTRIEGRSHA
jgi:hypothetical protein